MTAFYSWRLLFMTFHGKSRADHETLHHVHESPQVMLVPLIVAGPRRALRRHRLLSGLRRRTSMADYWRQSLFVLPGHDSIEAAHNVPDWVSRRR